VAILLHDAAVHDDSAALAAGGNGASGRGDVGWGDKQRPAGFHEDVHAAARIHRIHAALAQIGQVEHAAGKAGGSTGGDGLHEHVDAVALARARGQKSVHFDDRGPRVGQHLAGLEGAQVFVDGPPEAVLHHLVVHVVAHGHGHALIASGLVEAHNQPVAGDKVGHLVFHVAHLQDRPLHEGRHLFGRQGRVRRLEGDGLAVFLGIRAADERQ